MFTTLLTSLLGLIPRIFLGIVTRMLTESAVTKLLENVVVSLMKQAAALTSNTVDDDFVKDVERRFKQDRSDPDAEAG